MADLNVGSAPPGRAAAWQPQGEGQWALGHREPLNDNERIKRDDDPLNVRERIETTYSRRGFASIDPDDLHGRFRWMGLYTQRRPGIDGGRTAVLEPHELDDEYFMMRIRADGGQLDLAQLRTVARISRTYARDTADITDRQNIQLHWVRIEDVPAIWEQIEAVGLSTMEACGDCPRVICGSPVAGVAEAEIVDPTPAIREIVDTYLGDPDYANLPRKFKSSVAWLPDTPYQTNDLAFVGTIHPDLGPGFDLWGGGGLSTNPRLAERLGAWVPMHEIPEVWAAVVRLFREYGYRRLRSRARLKFLFADWGAARVRETLEDEFLGRPLVDGPAPELPDRPIDHVGVHRQWDGNRYVGVAPIAGRTSGTSLDRAADAVEAHGSHRVRLTPYQKLLVLDVAPERTEPLIAALREAGLSARPTTWRRNTMACTGIEFCKLAIVETKARAVSLVGEIERRLADLDVDISVNVNGCPNACARTQVADIGLKGQLVPGPDGTTVEGFQIHLGGGLALGRGQRSDFGLKLRGLKTSASELPDYVERVARNYATQRTEGETFAEWVLRADKTSLS
ncbi:nitrite/sulfite reductase [Phytohabitans flavus]|uniref:assimilatory sulfite reductase (ferredoxin) n=1 Tax=Phytohabitans flavus TaxID=1076124 RepID=A0A6F8XJV4_9ACTN|nr:nitrite/sulfite reductase [Phytohabitans flavus]BCB74096.1 ferredoxin--nitrite reductase [Phytohabitans flavus]